MISYINYDIIVRLMQAVEEGDIEIIDMWEEGDGDQDVTFVKRKLEKVLRELMADPRMAGHQHYGFKLQANPRGERIYACEANGSVAFQLAQLSMGPDTVPMALVAYIDGTFMKRGIGIRPIYCEYTYDITYDIIPWYLVHLFGLACASPGQEYCQCSRHPQTRSGTTNM